MDFSKNLKEEFLRDRSISEELLYDAFRRSIAEVFSLESGLPIEIGLENEENINVYVNRRITDNPIGFGEISNDEINKEPSLYKIEDEIAKELIKKMTISSLSRTTISKMQRTLQAKLVEIDKAKEFELFKDKVGELLSGSISRIEHGNIIVNLGLGEGFLPKHETIPGEFFSVNTNVQAYMFDIEESPNRYQIMLSRSRPEFIEKIISSMVPEVENGIIEIVSIARDAGIRSKVAVWSNNPTIEPVGSCIGKHGIRIKSIRSLIGNERIDIVRWDDDPAMFIGNALFPIEVSKFIQYSDEEFELVLSHENLLKANTHRRQQIKLAERLTGFKIRVISEEENVERSKIEDESASKMFKQVGISESDIKQLLAKNIKSVYEILSLTDAQIKKLIPSENPSDEDLASFKNNINNIYRMELKDEYLQLSVDPVLMDLPHAPYLSPSVFAENSIFDLKSLSSLEKDGIISVFIEFLSSDPDERIEQSKDILIWSRKTGGK